MSDSPWGFLHHVTCPCHVSRVQYKSVDKRDVGSNAHTTETADFAGQRDIDVEMKAILAVLLVVQLGGECLWR